MECAEVIVQRRVSERRFGRGGRGSTVNGQMGSSDYLFVQPSFLRSMASVLDLGAVLERFGYNLSRSPGEADARALCSDWSVIGSDLEEALREYRRIPSR